MSRPLTRTLKSLWSGVRIMLILTIVLGIAYPALILLIGQVALPSQANGSLLRSADGGSEVVASALIGQNFLGADGEPLRNYFQPRPSAAGENGYDPTASGGSNLGPESPQLQALITERLHKVAAFNDVSESEVPVDAVTASGSGLDPHISVAYAKLQTPRVALARDLEPEIVARAVEDATSGRDLGFMGEPRVNVVTLNLALEAMG